MKVRVKENEKITETTITIEYFQYNEDLINMI